MLVQWQKELYDLGINAIDEQHQQLFIIVNMLHSLIEQDDLAIQDRQKEAVSILKKLYNYSSYHFLSEEEIFLEYNYPGTDEHKLLHDKFREVIKNYLSDIREKPSMSLEYLQDFLVEWILEHISKEDRKYASFLKDNNISADIIKKESDRQKNDALLLWEKKKLELQIKEIDNQHRELVHILQQTNDLQFVSDRRKDIFIPVIIKKLIHYAQFHFVYEEELLAKNHYEDLGEQKEMHNAFISDVNDFYKAYNEGQGDQSERIIFFLREWVISHILKEDKKYKDYISIEKLGISVQPED